MIDGKQAGPFRLEDMPAAGITPDTYVWAKDMDDWKQAREVGDICRFFRNRLYDNAHTSSTTPVVVAEPMQEDYPMDDVPMRFRRQIEKADPDDVDFASFSQKPDLTRQPSTWWPFPMFFSLFFFLPLGILAISQAFKSRKAWKEGNPEAAYEYARRGKMAAGMSFSFGLIVIAAFIPLLF